MADVADILGRAPRPTVSEGEALLAQQPSAGSGAALVGGGGGAGGPKKKKPAGMSREVFNLIGAYACACVFLVGGRGWVCVVAPRSFFSGLLMWRPALPKTGKDGLAPVVVSKKAAGFKDKRDGAARTRWVWTDFKNSARPDDCRAFKHWVKASTDYPDYPFARFNVAKQAVAYSDEEYAAHLTVCGCGWVDG